MEIGLDWYSLIIHKHSFFAYAMESKDENLKYLKQFLIDFRELFKGLRVCEIRVLRSDNASEFNSAEVKQIYLDHSIKQHLANPEQQFQNGKAEKCWRYMDHD
jgi:transposase InsO family protein